MASDSALRLRLRLRLGLGLSVIAMACGNTKDAPRENACSIPEMTEQYAGDDPPATFAPGVPAPSCVARRHDVIVVLGCPTAADGSAAPCQMERANLALRAMRSGLGDDFITTGGSVQNAYVEAETLRDLLVERGAPEARIVLEPKAEHTDENLYWSSRIMLERGWRTALVVSDDPRHLVMTAVCDSNCCVRLGRLTVFDFALADGNAAGAPVKLGHYELHPHAPVVAPEECETILPKLMCLPLGGRRACSDRFALDP